MVFFSLYYYLFVDSNIMDELYVFIVNISGILVPIASVVFCASIIIYILMMTMMGDSPDDIPTKREIRKVREKHRKQLERTFKYKPKSSYSYLATDIVEKEVDEKKQKKTKKKELTMKTYSTGERDWDKV